jgi:hypothetical protein
MFATCDLFVLDTLPGGEYIPAVRSGRPSGSPDLAFFLPIVPLLRAKERRMGFFSKLFGKKEEPAATEAAPSTPPATEAAPAAAADDDHGHDHDHDHSDPNHTH